MWLEVVDQVVVVVGDGDYDCFKGVLDDVVQMSMGTTMIEDDVYDDDGEDDDDDEDDSNGDDDD